VNDACLGSPHVRTGAEETVDYQYNAASLQQSDRWHWHFFAVRIRIVTMKETVEQRVNIMAVVWRHVASYNVYTLTVDAVSRAQCYSVVGE